jgi:predicted phosphoribosyltransferase
VRSKPFRDRLDAGRALAETLARTPRDAVVLALPRGGVPVAFQVARFLAAPLDVLVVRKLGVPGQEELAMGAVAPGGARVLNPEVVAGVPDALRALEEAEVRERAELERQEALFRDGRPPLDLTGRTALLVDDGLATGATMRVAVVAAREAGARRVHVGVPIGAEDVCEALAQDADDVRCVRHVRQLGSVGDWYRDFRQTTDDEVRRLLGAVATIHAPDPLAADA